MLVISLGGSLINKDRINIELLKDLRTFLLNRNFVIITGGGRVAREYQHALSEFGKSPSKLDFMGIKATELNAFLVSNILNAKLMNFKDFSKYVKVRSKSKRVRIVSFGIKPGFTTDYVSVKFASFLKERTVINMSKIRFVRVNNKPVKHILWQDYLRLIPKKHAPGLKVPFDVEASKLAMKLKMRVIFVKTVDDLKSFVNERIIRGTLLD